VKRLLIPLFLAWCTVALANDPTYLGYRSWIIEHCSTNQVPADEQVFLATPPGCAPPLFTAILRYHDGLSIRDLIDKTQFRGTNATVTVLRSQKPNIVFDTMVSANERPTFALKPLDVILICDPRLPR
jgi:hypothetical protein